MERNHDLRTSLRLPFEPYCLIVFNEDHSQYQTELIRCPLMLQKYNYIIMTTRNWKYFSGLLSKTGIKAPDDRLAML